MKKIVKALLIGGVSVVFALCSSCAVPSSDAPEGNPAESSTSRDGLETVDVCTILTPEEQKELGFVEPGELDAKGPEPSCTYSGNRISAMITKNQNQTVDSYATKPGWAHFDRVSIDGRKGAQALQEDAVGGTLYDTMFDAGGGVIVVTVSEFRAGTVDVRAESLKLAERIAPRLPR